METMRRTATEGRRMPDQLGRWLRSHSVDWQFGLGAVLGFAPVIFQLSMITIGSILGGVIGLSLASAGGIAASWLMQPWVEGLPRRAHRRITAAPLVVYLAVGVVLVVTTLLLASNNRAASSGLLIVVWLYHSLYGVGFEPSSSPYERLRGRLARAVPLRVVVQWCGIAGVLLLLTYPRQYSPYQTLITGFMFTIVLAGFGASMKVFLRVRRLCTALNVQAGNLIAELERIRRNPGERDERRAAAEAAWRALHVTLRHKVDSPFSISGIFVLPSKTIGELYHQIHWAISAAGNDAAVHRRAVARLRMLRMAGAERTDIFA